MNGRCGLCNKEKELQASHIIPCFVFKWLKESSVTGYFRHGETINKRVQDGDKLYLLCWDCEQLFGGWEDIFAKEVFMPLHQNKPINQYGAWLLKFSTSVSWRVLTYFKNHLDLKHFPENLLMSVDNALRTWQEFLFDERPHPDGCEQHLLPFLGLIGNYSGTGMPSNFNRYVSRSVDIDVACSATEAFVYAKMCRILLIGFIEMDHRERWRDTKVHLKHGILEKNHYKVPATVSNFMFYKAHRLQEVEKRISDRQWKRIDKDYRKYSDEFHGSEMFKAITQDSILFGEAAFDD
ncbi:MAG: hypothetical protein ABSB95_14105 [Dissulfurispiraceae bacterium]|jgi:hypothetical protein